MGVSEVTKTEKDVSFIFYGDTSYAAAVAAGRTYEAKDHTFGDLQTNLWVIQEQIKTTIRGETKGVRSGDWPDLTISFTMPYRQNDSATAVTLPSIMSGRGYAWDPAGGNWQKNTSRTEGKNFGVYILINGTAHQDLQNNYFDLTGCTASMEPGTARNGEATVKVTITSPYAHLLDWGIV